MKEQGEPASAITVEYRPHGQSKSDSPPGIAIQLRAPRAGYHMVRLGPRWTEDHINASSATETAYGALNGAGSYLERISGVIAWDWKDWHRRWRDSPKRHPPSWTG